MALQTNHPPPELERLLHGSPGVVGHPPTRLALEAEPDPGVRVVLGHFIFVYIHPYLDGNGRMGRFLMNLMFASGGYAWTVVPVQQRTAYMAALESASAGDDIGPFVDFIGNLVGKIPPAPPKGDGAA